jgi:hypothetical protein
MSSAPAMYAQVIEHAASDRTAALSILPAIARLRQASTGMNTTADSASTSPGTDGSGRIEKAKLTFGSAKKTTVSRPILVRL